MKYREYKEMQGTRNAKGTCSTIRRHTCVLQPSDFLPDVLGHLRSKGNTLDPPAGAAGKLAQETLYMAVEDR